MKWTLVITLLYVVTTGSVVGQSLQVYPGDVTNNGEVNNLDFLQLGMAYNFAGPARVSPSQVFEAQAAMPWSYQFASGLNMAFADCNGDGTVNYYYDAFPLYTNYGLQRSNDVTLDVFTAGLPDVDPPLQFESDAVPAQVNGGQQIELPIELGSADIPAEDVYGIAFSMIVDPQLIDANSIMFNLSETSWANPDNDRIWMYKKVSNKRVDVAWVRTDQNQKRGFGKIGTVGFVIIVDVAPLAQQYFPVKLENIKLMDKFGNYSTVAGDTVLLYVPSDSSATGTENLPNTPQLSVMPNPATDKILLRTDENINAILLSDVLGQVLWSDQTKRGAVAEVQLPDLPAGAYLLRVETDAGVAFRKLQIKR